MPTDPYACYFGQLDASTCWPDQWVSSSTNITPSENRIIWKTWNANSTYATTATSQWIEWVSQSIDRLQSQLNAECRRQYAQAMDVDRQAARELQALAAVTPIQPLEATPTPADDKAEVLLRRILTPKQIEDYDLHKRFEVRSQSGKIYRLHKGKCRNILLLLPNGQESRQGYCIHPRESVPVADVLIAQKLLLEGDEESFLRTANAFDV